MATRSRNITRCALLAVLALTACDSRRGVIPDDFAKVSAFRDDERIRQELAYLIVRRARVLRALNTFSSGDWPVEEDKPRGHCISPSSTTVAIESSFGPETETVTKLHGAVSLISTQQSQARWAMSWDSSAAAGVTVSCLDQNTVRAPQGGWNGLVSDFQLEAKFENRTEARNVETKYLVRGIESYDALWQTRCTWSEGTREGATEFRGLDCSESGHLDQRKSGDYVSSRDVQIEYATSRNSEYEIWWDTAAQQLRASMRGGTVTATSSRYGVSMELTATELLFPNMDYSCLPTSGSLSGTISDTQTGQRRAVRVDIATDGKSQIAFDDMEATPFEDLTDADAVHCYAL